MKYGKTATALLAILLIFNIIFIFGNSMKDMEESQEVSDSVVEIIENIFSDNSLRDFITAHIRKIAHFTEFAVLGILSLLMTFILKKESKVFIYLFAFFGFIIALCDEGLQYFTGRGNSIKDVMIDSLGYYSITVLVILVLLLINYLKRKKEKKYENQGKD